MNKAQFLEDIQQRQRPTLVEFWAPWCAPCRVMAPALERVSQRYQGRVDLVRVNADEAGELVQALGVYGIPTLIAYDNGREVLRRTGIQSESGLAQIFEALAHGDWMSVQGPSKTERLLRLISGGVLLVLGLSNTSSWWLMVLGGVLMFSGVYDRFPVYRALAPKVKRWLRLEA